VDISVFMARICSFFVLNWIALCTPCLTAASATGYSLTNAFAGLTFTNPVCIASVPNETNRLFIVERKGRIVVITNLAVPTRSIFMDISSRVTNSTDTTVGGEEGLLGLAFHPGFATNGFFYVFYTGPATTSAGSGRHDILSRYVVSVLNPNQGDPTTETRYIVQFDQANNHNAGDLHFGLDGYLYVSLGDEGGAYGNYSNTQKIDRDFFSAIMRLDVDQRPGSLPPNAHNSALPSFTNYAIPPDNYFVGATSFNNSPVNPANARTEFWAVGMRNPWRFCFDPQEGTLYLGHVGQDNIEWINIVTNGANCGWNYYEGNKKWTNSLPTGFVLTPPLLEYGHTNGRNCIIGGVVYRGSRIAELNGAYLYCDHNSGEIWALRHSGMTVTENSLLLTSSSAKFNAFGADPSNGDVLGAAPRAGTNSTIERLVNTNAPRAPAFTGVVQSGTGLLFNGVSGLPNQSYHLLASTNIDLPSAIWSAVITGLFDAAGGFSITTSFDSNLIQRFYRLQSP
jgi:glucose/arabinose dehydrogenase